MNKINAYVIAWSSAPALIVAGLIMTLNLSAGLPARLDKIREKRENYSDLTRLAVELDRHEAAASALKELDFASAKRPSEVIGALSGAPEPAEVRKLGKELEDDWKLLQEELTFRSADLAALMPLITDLENKSRPWRLAKCSISATGEAGGNANVVLLMQVPAPAGSR